MNIHEYQAKKLLKKFKISVPQGRIAYTKNEARKAAAVVSENGPWVLKAQIQAGARAKGHFAEQKAKKVSGVEVVSSLEAVGQTADKMIGSTLITSQTDKKGKLVSKIYVEEHIKTKKTFYLSLIVNRIGSCMTLLVANATDNIVELAQKKPQSILRVNLNLHQRIKRQDVLNVLKFLRLDALYFQALKNFIQNLYKAFVDLDATMLEINPVGIDENDCLKALDAKISFDDNALYRHKDILNLMDDYETSETTLKAAQYGFKYKNFKNGNIGLIVNGEGLALCLYDYLTHLGCAPACYLNIRGGTDEDKIAQSIKLMMTNPKIEGILIDILGGFLRCDLVADGIVSAISEIGLNIPVAVRFEGTNKQAAIKIIEQSGLGLLMADLLSQSVEKLIQKMKEDA
ncbi:MAG: acetate--CoA ligase family protein [Alphaproteobacteria bacterium]|nr:acetate--CoA ligase family protein [Alphaproteobacteria bacterium]